MTLPLRPRSHTLFALSSAAFAALLVSACGGGSDSLQADIRVDTNRDGVVDTSGTSDAAGKSVWTLARGAIMLPNIGDSAKRCPSSDDMSQSDAALEACHDASDNMPRTPAYFAPVRTMPIEKATSEHVGTVQAVGSGADKVRLFVRRGDAWVYLNPGDRLTLGELQSGATLGIDARDVARDASVWDGQVTVRFSVANGAAVSTDDVRLRVAPVLTYNHTQAASTVLVPKSGSGGAHKGFVNDLAAAVNASGLSAPLVTMNTLDNWAQDFVEFGYVSMPKPNGEAAVIRIAIRSSQPGRVGGRAVFDLRGPGVGAVQLGGAGYHQVDSFGNLETIPPYELDGQKYPAGRIIYGDAGDGIAPHKDWRHFFSAQQVQAPIVLDTSWLAIGHVDEFVQFVPANTPRGWKIAIADPTGALELMKKAQREGHGATPISSRQGVTRTIDDLLSDTAFLAHNARAAQEIDKNLMILKRETGATAQEIIQIPGLYGTFAYELNTEMGEISEAPGDSAIVYGPGTLLSFHPGAINGIVMNRGHYISPKQWGPLIGGVDVLQQAVDAAYAQAGMTVHYVDDWLTHHAFAGEVHCGTNTIRSIDKTWWTSAAQ